MFSNNLIAFLSQVGRAMEHYVLNIFDLNVGVAAQVELQNYLELQKLAWQLKYNILPTLVIYLY